MILHRIVEGLNGVPHGKHLVQCAHGRHLVNINFLLQLSCCNSLFHSLSLVSCTWFHVSSEVVNSFRARTVSFIVLVHSFIHSSFIKHVLYMLSTVYSQLILWLWSLGKNNEYYMMVIFKKFFPRVKLCTTQFIHKKKKCSIERLLSVWHCQTSDQHTDWLKGIIPRRF